MILVLVNKLTFLYLLIKLIVKCHGLKMYKTFAMAGELNCFATENV